MRPTQLQRKLRTPRRPRHAKQTLLSQLHSNQMGRQTQLPLRPQRYLINLQHRKPKSRAKIQKPHAELLKPLHQNPIELHHGCKLNHTPSQHQPGKMKRATWSLMLLLQNSGQLNFKRGGLHWFWDWLVCALDLRFWACACFDRDTRGELTDGVEKGDWVWDCGAEGGAFDYTVWLK